MHCIINILFSAIDDQTTNKTLESRKNKAQLKLFDLEGQGMKSLTEELNSIAKEIDSLKEENKEIKNLVSLVLKHGRIFITFYLL